MSAPQRPILPRPTQALVSPDGEGPGGGAPGPQQQLLPRARRNTKAACETCRKSKVKCSGERPTCLHCQARGADCIYLADSAETQVQALKRKHDESLHENVIYRELYRLLVTVSEAEAFDILQRLRAGTDVETTVRQVHEGDLLLQLALRPELRFRYQFPYLPSMPAPLQTSDNPYLESLLYEGAAQGLGRPPLQQQQQQPSYANETVRARSNSQIYMKPYHAAEIIDGRLASARAADWTTVTTDDNLFRRLLRAYLTHEYCVAPAFQKDYFLYDLGRGKGHLCSPLLVNSVMAIGSHCHRSNAFRSQLWNPQNIGYRFLVEARRLWELEDLDNVRLTTFQATVLLSLAYNSHGMDKIGDIFIRHAVSMARKMNLFGRATLKNSRTQRALNQNHEPHLRGPASLTGGVLGRSKVRRVLLHAAGMAERAARGAPAEPGRGPGLVRRVRARVPAQHGRDADVLAADVPGDVRPPRDHEPGRARGLPRPASAVGEGDAEAQGAGDTVAAPGVVRGAPGAPAAQDGRVPLPPETSPSLEYFSIHITLATTVIEEENEIHASTDLERSINSSSSGGGDDTAAGDAPLLTQTGPAAMRHLETVARLYYMRHGFEGCDSTLAYFLALLASVSLRALEGGGDGARLAAGRGSPEVLRSTLVLAMKGLHDQGRHLHVCKVLFRLLRDRMRPAEADILGRFVVSSGEGGGDGDGGGDGRGEAEGEASEADLVLHTRSRFPVPMVKMGEDLNAAILENLVGKYQAVSLESSSSSSGSGNSEEDVTTA